MLGIPNKRLLSGFLALASVVLVCGLPCRAQDDPNEAPLGDVARNLRKKAPPAQNVIDDDNFSNVVSQIESKRAAGASLKYVMAGDNKGFQVSAPDATCSLSFSANAKVLLSSQYAEMELPPADVAKLQGPAAVEGDALTISVFNGTEWHVSEVAVAFTVIRKHAAAPSVFSDVSAPSMNPISPPAEAATDAVRPEKKSDTTVIYHMRAVGPPLSRAVFSSPLNLDLAAGDEWHWAIVQAKGYPPQGWADTHHIEQAQTPAISLPADESVANPNPLLPTGQELSPTQAGYNPPQ